MTWIARFDGTCAFCLGQIRADHHLIRRDQDGDYVHVQCPDPLAIPGPGVCPFCHLTLPATGVCEEC